MKDKINLNLVGIDSNAFSIMSAFSKQARREGWKSDEIHKVTEKAMNGDYNHLLRTFMKYCNDESE